MPVPIYRIGRTESFGKITEKDSRRQQNRRGNDMKKRLQRILSLLCVLALCWTAAAALADAEVQQEARILTVEWKDGDNYDGLRPKEVTAELAGQTVTMTEASGWAATVTVPAGTDNAWTFTAPEGYTGTLSEGPISTLTFSRAVAPAVSVSASVEWKDADNASKVRPASVQLALKADGELYGEPKDAKAPAWKATWEDLPRRKPASDTDIVYTVVQIQTPEGYAEETSGLTVTNTLQTGKLTLTATASGMPEGTDISGLSMSVTGPDPSMPRTIKFSELSNGSYDFGEVLPGAYLVQSTNGDDMIDGYIVDSDKSDVSDAVLVRSGETGALKFAYAWKLPEAYEAEEDYDPMAGIGKLTFEILGPAEGLPMTVTYADFTDGKYELPDLIPGSYTVVERNAEKLVQYYTLTSESVTGMALTVAANGTSTAKLFNQYVPAPTPEPDAEFVDIPVTKTWNDSNNRDGNRPATITVRLYADGVEVDSHVLTEAENWAFTFVEKPRYQEDHKTEIVYSVNEDAVPMYATAINGYNIVNNYQPEVISTSVSKVWHDNNNELNQRPTSIAMTLYNGDKIVKVVVLNEQNGWAATVNDLPVIVDGETAKYGWKEQEVLGYTLESVRQDGNVVIFTNATWQRPENPTQGTPPRVPGKPVYIFEEYDTPLGVEIVINHVGDCFD